MLFHPSAIRTSCSLVGRTTLLPRYNNNFRNLRMTSTDSDSASKTLLCVADFCLIPMGPNNEGESVSVAKEIAACQRVLAKTGLTYKMHGYGTGLEGPWDEVMTAIRLCHEAVHGMGRVRISTDIRVGTRTDKQGSNAAKLQAVQKLLATDES